MKIAKFFLAGMYLHLLLSIAVPIVLLRTRWSTWGISLFVFYIVMIGIVLIVGCITAIMALVYYRDRKYEGLRKGWKLLKLGGIPFYVINFVYSVCAWFILVGASRGLFIFLIPIPIILTGAFILQSGCVGACYVKYLRSISPNSRKVSTIHYVLQFISVLDIISTLIILRRERNN